MTRSYRKNIRRTFKHTKSRFIAIFSIVALGVGFLAGLNATPDDMKESMEAYMDDANFYDIRVVSTLGLTDDDVSALAAIDGVKDVQPAYNADLLVQTGDDTVVARAHSLPLTTGAEKQDIINKLFLVDGRMPEKSGECVVEAGANDMASAYPIGSKLVISPENEDLDSKLSTTEYEVVGIVHSANYFSFEREPASVGNGRVNLLMYLLPEDYAFAAYTEIYLTVDGALAANSLGDDYDPLVDAVKTKIEAIQDLRCQTRYDEIYDEAQQKIDDAWDSYNEAKEEADQKLSDAKTELTDGEKELADGQAEYEQGEADYADALSQIAENEQKLADGEIQLSDAKRKLQEADARISNSETLLQQNEAKLDSAKTELDKGQAQYDSGMTTYQSGKKQLEDGQAQLDAAKEQLDTAKAGYQSGLAGCVQGMTSLLPSMTADGLDGFLAFLSNKGYGAPQTTTAFLQNMAEYGVALPSVSANSVEAAYLEQWISQLLPAISQLYSARESITAGQSAYDANADKLAENKKLLADSKEQLAQANQKLQKGQKQYDEGRKQLENGKKQLAGAKAMLAGSWATLSGKQTELTDGLSRISDAKASLKDARNKLDDAKATIAENAQKLADGEISYEDAKKEVDEKLADARQEIEDGQTDLDTLEMPKWYVWGRDKNVSYSSFTANIDKLNAITTVFPVFFFLVAALVVSTTMTRMVEEERLQIGTMKALGYSARTIMQKYILYALTASVSGTLVGLAVGFKAFPSIIWSAYEMMYYMPAIATPWRLSQALFSGGTLIALSLLVTALTCRSSLSEVPATLMLPRAPKAGKRILLERITPLWRHFPFSWKVTCRNLFRYKKRFWMTVIGVAGCTSLLIAGFGISDSLNAIITKQYDDVFHYDLMTIVTEEDALTQGSVQEYLFENPTVFSDSLAISIQSTRQEAEDGDVDVYLMVPKDLSAFGDFVDLHERISRKATPLQEDGIIVTEKLAKTLGIQAGDSITLQNEDEEKASFTVTGVCEHYVSNYVYMSAATYKAGFKKAPVYNAALSKMPDDSQTMRDQVSAVLLDMDHVASLTFTQDNVKQVLNMLNSIDAVVVLIIVCAAGLAFVVLYNLSNINVAERVKEIATIKVLGFYDREVDSYVNRESYALTIIGIFFGIFGGIALHRFVITTVEVDAVMFGRSIRPVSFLYAILLTLLFSIIVSLVIGRSLKKVSMVESMKAPE
ncbi:ABC transporter permease [Kineothrix sp. MSJ-39]|uniref:FtsX-like permease family protein n=1 Tax=Kineothrix sp. MSJ-39 TaxID=2841533 RepID=UPI001C119A54|nr:FtsX-like permease family protein [Kineothrix sp. MSJ-39]MBU5428940.1 ABC transporter permease [Kineothrix sp. MSJ-39]